MLDKKREKDMDLLGKKNGRLFESLWSLAII